MLDLALDRLHAPPTLAQPVSQAVTQAQFAEPSHGEWCKAIRETPRHHRKQWEFVYILQALQAYGMIGAGRRGIGYGVGEEPLPDLLAHLGCSILASDLDLAEAVAKGWATTGQHAAALDNMNKRGICDPTIFGQRVSFRVIDMNARPRRLRLHLVVLLP